MPCAVEAAGKFLRAAADRRPVEAVQVDLRRQHAGDGGAAAVDLLGEPDQLVRRADLIHAVLLSGLHRGLHGDGARGLRFAAGGGDGGGALALGGDDAVLHGGDRVIGGCPHQRVGGVLRGHGGGQSRLFSGVQAQRRLVQRHAGGGNGFAGQLDIQLIGGARHSVHNGQIGDLAGAVCRGERNILADQKLVQLRGGQRKGIAALIIEVAAFAVRYHQESSVLDLDGSVTAIGDGNVIFARLTIDRLDGIGCSAHLHADGACGGRRYRDGAFRLCAAAGGGDGGRTGLHSGDNAIFHGSDRVIGGSPDDGLVGGVLRFHGGGQSGGLALGQAQLRLIQRHAGGGNVRASLFKPHRHIVIGEVGGLGEAVAVIAGTGDVERYLADLAQTGQIPLRPVHDNVIRAVAQIDAGLAGLCALGIIADSHQLYPVVRADLGGQAVAVDVAVQGIGGVGDVHMVNDTLRTVGECQGGQRVRTKSIAGVVRIAIVHGEVVGAVMATAGAGQAGNALFIDGELCVKSAVVRDVTRVVVGNGVAAAPIAPAAVTLGENVVQPSVVGVRPLVSLICGVDASAAAAVQQLAAVLGIVDQGRPVIAIGKVGAALIVGILKGQHPQVIILALCKSADRQQRYRHHQRQQQREDSFLHV